MFRTWKTLTLSALLGVAAIAVAACGGQAEPEVITEVQTVIVEKQVPGEAVVQTVIVEKQVPGQTVLQTVIVEKQVPGQTVLQTVVVEKQVPGQPVVQTVVVEKIVIQAPEPEVQQPKGTLVVADTNVGPPLFLPSALTAPFDNKLVHWGFLEGIIRAEYAPPPLVGPITGDGIATSWEVSPDLQKITFKLRRGVQFHKGWGEVTAHDVEFSFNDSLKEGSRYARLGEFEKYMDRWEALDDFTVVVHIKPGKFWPRWDLDMSNVGGAAIPVVSKKVFDQKGEEGALTTMVGTGPFDPVDWTTDEEIRAEAVIDHWRQTPGVAEMRIVAIPEVSSRVAAFKTGEVDIAPIPLRFLKDTISDGGTVQTLNQGRGQNVAFGGNYWAKTWTDEPDEVIFPRPGLKADDDHPWIGHPDDPVSMERARKVRLALAMSINRELINDEILAGLGRASVTFTGILKTDSVWKDEWAIPYDVEGAKALLAEAGFPSGFSTDFYVPADLTVVEPEIGEVVAQMWRAIGIEVSLEKTAYATRRPTLVARNFDIPWLILGPYSELGTTLVPAMAPSAGFNLGVEIPNDIAEFHYRNISDFDPQKPLANAAGLQDFMSKWVLFAPTVDVTEPFAVRPEVIEWTPSFEPNSFFSAPETVVKRD